MYDIKALVNKLKSKGLTVAIETSGTYILQGDVDWYCFSPKKFKDPVEESYEKASELKVIVNHPSDIEWAEMHATKVSKNCILYLQPEWSKRERFLPLIIDHVKNNPVYLRNQARRQSVGTAAAASSARDHQSRTPIDAEFDDTNNHEDDDDLAYHYIIHTVLDVIEERAGIAVRTTEMYLGLLYALEDVNVYGYLSNTGLKFLVVIGTTSSSGSGSHGSHGLGSDAVRDSELRLVR